MIHFRFWNSEIRCTAARLYCLVMFFAISALAIGCRSTPKVEFDPEAIPCQLQYQRIEVPALCDQNCEVAHEFMSGAPPTISNYHSLASRPMTLEEAVMLTLQNSKVLNKIGGRVISGPQGTATIYDPALQATSPTLGVEAALSAFDAQASVCLLYTSPSPRDRQKSRMPSSA